MWNFFRWIGLEDTQAYPKKESFKHLESIIQKSGDIDDDITHHIGAVWKKWRLAFEIQCEWLEESEVQFPSLSIIASLTLFLNVGLDVARYLTTNIDITPLLILCPLLLSHVLLEFCFPYFSLNLLA